MQLRCDAAITVSSFVFVVDCRDFFLNSFVLIYTLYPFQMIVEGGRYLYVYVNEIYLRRNRVG